MEANVRLMIKLQGLHDELTKNHSEVSSLTWINLSDSYKWGDINRKWKAALVKSKLTKEESATARNKILDMGGL